MKKYRWLGLLVGMIVIFLWWRHSSRNFHHIYMQSRTHQFEDVESVTIGTYNLKSLNMGESLEEAIVDLRAANLDIVCLQEVDEKSWRSIHLAMTKEIADALGYEYYAFFQTMFLGQGYYGIAIISRYPIMEISSQSLKVSLLKEPKERFFKRSFFVSITILTLLRRNSYVQIQKGRQLVKLRRQRTGSSKILERK